MRLLALALILGAFVWMGRDFALHIPTLEAWTASHGWLGWVVFVAAAVLFTSLFVPDTVFAVTAGVVYGVVGGTVLMIIAVVCTATLNFVLSRTLLRHPVQRALAVRPRLAAIQRAVGEEGLQFQFLLRLTPVNPVAVSYALGASDTRFTTFLLACAGLFPSLAVEVYFGHATRHALAVAGGTNQHSALHLALTMAGLILCIAVLIYVTQVARKALARYDHAVVPANEPAAARSTTTK